LIIRRGDIGAIGGIGIEADLELAHVRINKIRRRRWRWSRSNGGRNLIKFNITHKCHERFSSSHHRRCPMIPKVYSTEYRKKGFNGDGEGEEEEEEEEEEGEGSNKDERST